MSRLFHPSLASALAILAAIAGCVTITACRKSTSNPVGPGDSPDMYMPLTVGNWWVYAGWDTDSLGAKVAGSDRTYIDSVIAQFTVGGRTGYVMSHWRNDTLRGNDSVGFNANGDYEACSDTAGNGHPVWTSIAHLSNIDPARSYLTFIARIDTVPTIDTLVEKYVGSAMVTTPAGSFTARRYSTTMSTDFSFGGFIMTMEIGQGLQFAPHVGQVRVTATVSSVVALPPPLGELRTTVGSVQELTAYHVSM